MSDLFYRIIRTLGTPAFWVSSRPTIIGTENLPRTGAFILAANHASPYDVPLLIRHSSRPLDFVSIVEVFRNPLVAWFYGSLNAFPLDRSRADTKTVRVILDRLSRGRAVAIFPEGGLRRGADSMFESRKVRPGVARLAELAAVPVIPCVIINSEAYSRAAGWLPFRRTRYGVIFGPPLAAGDDPSAVEGAFLETMLSLHQRLTRELI